MNLGWISNHPIKMNCQYPASDLEPFQPEIYIFYQLLAPLKNEVIAVPKGMYRVAYFKTMGVNFSSENYVWKYLQRAIKRTEQWGSLKLVKKIITAGEASSVRNSDYTLSKKKRKWKTLYGKYLPSYVTCDFVQSRDNPSDAGSLLPGSNMTEVATNPAINWMGKLRLPRSPKQNSSPCFKNASIMSIKGR